MITGVAIKIADVVCFMPRPNRHHNILHSLSKSFTSRTDRGYKEEIQGFITDEGIFLDRQQAMKHAIECGQGIPRRIAEHAKNPNIYTGPELYSEDLW